MKKSGFLLLSLCLFLVGCSNTQEEFSMKEKCNQYNEDILEYVTPNYTPNKYGAFYSSNKNTCLGYFFGTERGEATAVGTKLFDTLDRYIVVDLLSKKNWSTVNSMIEKMITNVKINIIKQQKNFNY